MYKTKLKFISIFISGLVVFFVLFNTDLLAIDKEFHPAEVTVEQTTTSIKIAWENTASEYYVYLDDKKIEKIVSPSTTIKNLESDHPYSIRIQALEDGEIVDNMVVQTKTRMNTTDKKQKKFENEEGLTTAIFTDHEAKVMFEQALDDDGKFEVLRDQKKIGTINMEKNFIIDLNLKPETSYRYSIVGEVALKDDEKKAAKAELKRYQHMSPKAIDVNELNKQHQLARTFKTLKKEHKDSVNATYFDTETWSNPDLGVEFTYSTFIEPKSVFFYIPKLSKSYLYYGDGRGFDEHNLKNTQYRTKTITRVSFPAGGGSVIRFKHHQNPTTHVTVKGEWLTTPNPQTGISIKKDPRSDRAFFTIKHAATNPAHKIAGIVDAPPIDYEVNGEVYKNGSYELTGFHDKAPHHEMIMTKVPGEVHQDDSGKLVYSSYTHLFKDKMGSLGFNELWSWAGKITINEQGFWK